MARVAEGFSKCCRQVAMEVFGRLGTGCWRVCEWCQRWWVLEEVSAQVPRGEFGGVGVCVGRCPRGCLRCDRCASWGVRWVSDCVRGVGWSASNGLWMGCGVLFGVCKRSVTCV